MPKPDFIDLRQRAQERLHEDGRAEGASATAAVGIDLGRVVDNPRRLLNELEVYQIELELQNEQLEAARAWIEAALASYTELYDYAPVPYLTLNRFGVIMESNLAGARLLGIERARVLDKRLERFVVEADRQRFTACIKTVFTTANDALCELALVNSEGTVRTVEMRATLSNKGDTCRAVLIDVSERSAHARHMARLGDVFSLAHEAMFITDHDGSVVDVNLAFIDLTGYSRAQIVGKHASVLLCESQSPAREATIARAATCCCATATAAAAASSTTSARCATVGARRIMCRA
jgi:PAS domain S-box-containing protein